MKTPTLTDYSKFIQKYAGHGRRDSMPVPMVSYITACYNRAVSIRKTVDSLMSQTDRDFEYIVIDGGSTDGTLEILQSYGDRITVLVSEPDGGIYDAFNRGVALSRGRWLNIVNSDDWIDPNTLANFRKTAEALPASVGVICGQTRFFNSNGKGYLFESSPALLRQESTIGHNAAYIKRAVHEELGLYRTDLKLASDYDFFLRCLNSGKVLQAVSTPLVNMSADGASDRNWVRLYKEIAQVQKEHLGDSFLVDLKLCRRLVRTWASKSLSRMGLEPVVTVYRRFFSPLKNTRL